MKRNLFLYAGVLALTASLSLTGCSVFSKKSDSEASAPAASQATSETKATIDPGGHGSEVKAEGKAAELKEAAPGQAPLPVDKGTISGDGPSIVLKPDTKVSATSGHDDKPAADVKETKDVKKDEHAAAKHEEVKGVDPEVALRYLRNGNTRFVKGYLRKDGQAKKDIDRIAKGQKPHTIVISCSDSRVPPEIVFDQKLGEIFVVRTAGQALGKEAVASVEYAVAHLGARLIVVLGHSSCGAVAATVGAIKGAHGDHPDPLAESQNLAALAGNIRPRIEDTVLHHASPRLINEGWANVRGAARELFQTSPYLQESLKTGQVRIVGGLYDLENGQVEFK